MTIAERSQGGERSRSRSPWIKYMAVAVASLAVLASGVPVAGATSPSLAAAAHFRGPQSHAAHAYSLVQSNAHRRLDTNATMNNAVDKANEVGASVRKAVKQLRGGTDKFYHDLITALKITLCEQLIKDDDPIKNPKIRFVNASSERAYTDSNGDCIRLNVTAETDPTVVSEYNSSRHRCEVQPNCYWGEVYRNQTERTPVYATDQSVQPPAGSMTSADAEDTLKKWAQGLMIFVVPGIILAVLSLLTMIFFLLCRCCCNRCGGRSPKEGGYTCMQKFWPLLFFLLFAAGVIVVAGVSLLYQKTLTTAVSDMFQSTSDTLGGANNWIGAIKAPLVDISGTVTTSASKIKTELDGTDFINDGLTGLTDRLTTFGEYSADRTLPQGCEISDAEPYCVPCEFCTTISTEVAKSTTQIKENAGDGVKQLKAVKADLNDKLVEIAGSVRTTVESQVEMLNTLTTTVTDVQKQVDDAQDQYEKQKAAQQAGVLGLFALALVVIVLGFVGILFGLTPLKFLANIIHIAYIIGFIALFITFLISAVFLALSVVLGDVCEVTSILQTDWRVPLGEQAKGINACFTNESLIETFNLSSSLEFARGGVQFPDNDLGKMLDFSDLDTFAGEILKINASTFDTSDLDKLFEGLNTLVKQNVGDCKPNDDNKYTMDTVLAPWTANMEARTGDETPEAYIKARYAKFDTGCDPANTNTALPYECKNPEKTPCMFSDAVEQLFHGAKMLTLVVRDSDTFVADLHMNITVVTDYTDGFKGQITTFDGKIDTIKDDLQSSLIKNVNDFEKAMYCTFVADGYFEIYEALCGKLMPSLTMISLMIFLAGVFLFPVNVCLIIAVKRLKARGNGGHVMDNEMKFK